MDFATPQFEEILEQGKQTATNTVKNAVSDTTNLVSGQLGIQNQQTTGLNQSGEQPLPNQQSGANSELTKEMVEDFYAPSVPTAGVLPKTQEEQITQQKLLKIRKDLHEQTYYNPLIAYEHKKEERPAEVAEKEEQQKKTAELEQKKEDKNLPVAVQMGQAHAERFPGVAG